MQLSSDFQSNNIAPASSAIIDTLNDDDEPRLLQPTRRAGTGSPHRVQACTNTFSTISVQCLCWGSEKIQFSGKNIQWLSPTKTVHILSQDGPTQWAHTWRCTEWKIRWASWGDAKESYTQLECHSKLKIRINVSCLQHMLDLNMLKDMTLTEIASLPVKTL